MRIWLAAATIVTLGGCGAVIQTEAPYTPTPAYTLPLRLLNSKGASLLTPRERDVVRLVADGFCNREVAAQLGLSAHTVKNYLFNVFDKLGVSSRAELIMYVLSGPNDSIRPVTDTLPRREEARQASVLRTSETAVAR